MPLFRRWPPSAANESVAIIVCGHERGAFCDNLRIAPSACSGSSARDRACSFARGPTHAPLAARMASSVEPRIRLSAQGPGGHLVARSCARTSGWPAWRAARGHEPEDEHQTAASGGTAALARACGRAGGRPAADAGAAATRTGHSCLRGRRLHRGGPDHQPNISPLPISLHLPTSPYMFLHLPHLPTPLISLHLLHLPISPQVSLCIDLFSRHGRWPTALLRWTSRRHEVEPQGVSSGHRPPGTRPSAGPTRLGVQAADTAQTKAQWRLRRVRPGRRGPHRTPPNSSQRAHALAT